MIKKTRQIRIGTEWKALGDRFSYTITYNPESFECFSIAIRNKDDSPLEMKDIWKNYSGYFTLRGAIKYCRMLYGEENIKFKRKNP